MRPLVDATFKAKLFGKLCFQVQMTLANFRGLMPNHPQDLSRQTHSRLVQASQRLTSSRIYISTTATTIHHH